MIKEFKNNPYKQPSGIVVQGMMEQIKLLYQKDPGAAGELAISFIEEVLTGDHSSDDFMVEFSLANFKGVIENNRNKREATIAANESKEVEVLRPLAELHNKGWTQAQIAKELKMAQSTVSKKLTKIRTNYPWMIVNEENIQNIPEQNNNIPNNENIIEYSDNKNNIPNEEYILDIPNIPIFEIFQHDNENDNEYVNDNDNVAGNSSNSSGQGCAPTPPTASPMKIGGFEF